MEANERKPKPEALSIGELVQDVVSQYRLIAQQKGEHQHGIVKGSAIGICRYCAHRSRLTEYHRQCGKIL